MAATVVTTVSPEQPQQFWVDDDGLPVAAVIATRWREVVGLDPVLLPDATPSFAEEVVRHGVAAASSAGLGPLEVRVDAADWARRRLLEHLGFVLSAGRDVTTRRSSADEHPGPRTQRRPPDRGEVAVVPVSASGDRADQSPAIQASSALWVMPKRA